MIDPEIAEFIEALKVATVCTSKDDLPYCFNCYYAFSASDGYLIYKSSFGTRHEKMLGENPNAAGTIIPEQIEVSTIRGIQFEGVLLADNFDLNVKAASLYYLKFPFAVAVPGKLYVIRLDRLKFTDNTRGFGFKQVWERQQA